jgi:hypothetical protein
MRARSLAAASLGRAARGPSSSLVQLQFLKKDLAHAAELLSAERSSKAELLSAERSKAALLGALLQEKARAHIEELARKQHELDMARGTGGLRALLEGCTGAIWHKLYPSGGSRAAPKGITSVSGRLKHMLGDGGAAAPAPGCPSLVAFARAAGALNHVPQEEVLRQARRLYETRCSPLHSEALGGTHRLPAELFASSGRAALVACASLVGFSGRDLGLYTQQGEVLEVLLPLERGLGATEQDMLASGASCTLR